MSEQELDDCTRLSVNINVHTQAELRKYMDRHGTTLTETVRRLISYGATVEQAWENGEDVLPRRSRLFSETYTRLERQP